jgi:hypothetical protein
VKRSGPLRIKRPLQRSGPIKRKAKARPPKQDRDHMARVASLPCAVPGCGGQATVHHVTSDGFQRITRSDRLTVPLCPRHHQIQWGPHESVEALGHGGFERQYGVNLLQLAQQLWRETEALA